MGRHAPAEPREGVQFTRKSAAKTWRYGRPQGRFTRPTGWAIIAEHPTPRAYPRCSCAL